MQFQEKLYTEFFDTFIFEDYRDSGLMKEGRARAFGSGERLGKPFLTNMNELGCFTYQSFDIFSWELHIAADWTGLDEQAFIAGLMIQPFLGQKAMGYQTLWPASKRDDVIIKYASTRPKKGMEDVMSSLAPALITMFDQPPAGNAFVFGAPPPTEDERRAAAEAKEKRSYAAQEELMMGLAASTNKINVPSRQQIGFDISVSAGARELLPKISMLRFVMCGDMVRDLA